MVKTSGQRQSINVISAVNARGAFWAVTYDGKLNAASFVIFLRGFYERAERESVSGLGWPSRPQSQGGQEIRGEFGGRLELHPLPTYAPDLNPDEFVWSYMKNNGVSKKPLKKDESLRKRVEEDLVMIQFNRPLVRSFFGAKSVAYAAD